MEDAKVTEAEYEAAFWTFVECAEAAGATFNPITRVPGGNFRYSTGGTQGDACYQTHFGTVDMTWQVEHN